MRTQTVLFLTIGSILWSACEFNVGSKKDFLTGLSVTHDGFSIGESYLVGPDNTRKADNKVPLNSTVTMMVEGIENYEIKDGKAYPGLTLTVTDEAGNAVLNEHDLLADYAGVPPSDAAILRGTVTVGHPMESGKTYHVIMRVWDKNKPENEIIAEGRY